MSSLRIIHLDPRPRQRIFIDMHDDDGEPIGIVLDHAPMVPILHMAIEGNWKWDKETQRQSALLGIHQTKHKWRYLYDGFIDSDEQAYFLSVCDCE